MDDTLFPFTNSFMVLYLDKLIIFNKSWEEHFQNIGQVLQTLQQQKICPYLDKCTFGMFEVQFLSYIIDEKGMHLDQSNIQFIHDWPTPTTLIELCSFLGLPKFYKRFALGLFHMTWPLS